MNADLQRMITFHKKKSMANLIITDKGKTLNDREARAFVTYCVSLGYEKLYDCPEFEQVKDRLTL